MQTHDLVTMLAAGESAADSHIATRRLALAIGWGGFGSVLLMALSMGVRPDIHDAAAWPMFWVKLAFALLLVGAGLFASLRLGRPGASLSPLLAAIAAPVIAIWVLGIFALVTAEPAARPELVWGQTASVCPLNIALLSTPAFLATLWAMRGLAPTQPRRAGAAAGLLAGAVGATVYALHCPELTAPFIGTWYVVGILGVTMVGALIGPRFLRW